MAFIAELRNFRVLNFGPVSEKEKVAVPVLYDSGQQGSGKERARVREREPRLVLAQHGFRCAGFLKSLEAGTGILKNLSRVRGTSKGRLFQSPMYEVNFDIMKKGKGFEMFF